MSSINSLKDCTTVEQALSFRALADYQARCFVNPMRRHGRSGKFEPVGYEFAERFLPHPWVREAITEGWDRELRGHLIRTIRDRILRAEPYDVIEDLMPPKEWVAYANEQAARYRRAAEWQKENCGLGVDFSRLLKTMPTDDEPEAA